MRLTVTRDGLLAQDVMRPFPLPADPCDLRALPIEVAIDYLKYTEEDSREVCQKLGPLFAGAVGDFPLSPESGVLGAVWQMDELRRRHIPSEIDLRRKAVGWAWYWALDPTPINTWRCFAAARVAWLSLEKAKEIFDETIGL